MSADHTKSSGYQSLKSKSKSGAKALERDESLKPSRKNTSDNAPSSDSLNNSLLSPREKNYPLKPISGEKVLMDNAALDPASGIKKADAEFEGELTYAEQQKHNKKEKKIQKDFELLSGDGWLAKNGHTLTYIGLYLFSILVLFRPYELVSSLSFLSATAFYFALATLIVFLPTQFLTEGNATNFSTEVKAILAMTFLALITMPIAKSPITAWDTFSDMFIKAVVMFIVMINVLRTRARLLGMIWLSLFVGLYLSYSAVGMYARGELNTEGYRVAVEVGGLFGNSNDLALHLVTMTPLAITLGIASRKRLAKLIYFVMAGLFIAANTVTYSRGGFLGLLAVGMVLVWKLGRKSRLKISIVSILVSFSFLLFAPGNYGTRMLSIFIPALDPVGSSDQRRELLIRSILVTLRNPWGIGIGNFPIVGIRNLQTHNAYTQVSSEIGILGLAAYLVFMISPFRKLSAIERLLFERDELNWFYYLSIGFQASIIGYMVSSFFVPVAYNWFIYYLIAYAVAFRRIYKISFDKIESETKNGGNSNTSLGLQTA